MGFRVVKIKNVCKLDLKMNYLVYRGEKDTVRIFIPEISILILESTAISLTTALISELTKNNIKIIFCDEKHNPESELVPYNLSYHSSKRLKMQIGWDDKIKGKVWAKIVKEKIKTEMLYLLELEHFEEAELLKSYYNDVKINDKTNREGHSAKVYFNAVFGNDFARRTQSFTNTALNYGYAILLSCFNREIVASGYLTQLGIWHKGEFNYYNLSSDFIEPFRVLVDRIVYNLNEGDNYKLALLNLLDAKIKIDKKEQTVENAIAIYASSLFDALNKNDVNLINFYEL